MQLNAELNEGLAKSWKWLYALGFFLIVVGVVAIAVPAAASVGIAIFIGWIFLISGIFQFASAFSFTGGQLLVRVLMGLIAIFAGIYILAAPLEGTVTLTFVMGLFFLISGVGNLIGGIAFRGTGNAGAVVLSGILSIIIALLVLTDLPSSAAWAIGLLAGVNFIFDGFAMIAVGSAGKAAAKG